MITMMQHSGRRGGRTKFTAFLREHTVLSQEASDSKLCELLEDAGRSARELNLWEVLDGEEEFAVLKKDAVQYLKFVKFVVDLVPKVIPDCSC